MDRSMKNFYQAARVIIHSFPFRSIASLLQKEIPEFSDPHKWLAYFPPWGKVRHGWIDHDD